MNCLRWFVALLGFIGLSALSQSAEPSKSKETRPPISDDALVMIVMDPLAAPLSCPCVQGYAQRNYDKLGTYLSEKLQRPVAVVFSESLVAAVQKETKGRADIVIGKHSVVLADAKQLDATLKPALALSGKDGQTVMTGLIVVPANDPAKSVADLKGYRIFFGPAECDEKHAAALRLFKDNQIDVPKSVEICTACSDGATKILELGKDVRAATVISSYAAPLLEGCGTIKKGDLRVIGTTETVPFVEAFFNSTLPAAEQKSIRAALSDMVDQPELLQALETQLGFMPLESQKKRAKLIR